MILSYTANKGPKYAKNLVNKGQSKADNEGATDIVNILLITRIVVLENVIDNLSNQIIQSKSPHNPAKITDEKRDPADEREQKEGNKKVHNNLLRSVGSHQSEESV